MPQPSFDLVVRWVADNTLTCSPATILAWCRTFELVPSADSPLWETMLKFVEKCPTTTPPRKLHSAKELQRLMENIFAAATRVLDVQLSPWVQAAVHNKCKHALDRIVNAKQLWPLECTTLSLTHVVSIWKQERPQNAKHLLQHFLVLSIMAQNMLIPFMPTPSRSLIGGEPSRLHQLAKKCLQRNGFSGAAGWQGMNLAFWLGNTAPMHMSHFPPPPSFLFCGDLAQITGIEGGLNQAPRAGTVRPSTPSTCMPSSGGAVHCAVLGVHAQTGQQELLCVDGRNGRVLGRIQLKEACMLVKGAPFANMAAVVTHRTGRLTFYRWSGLPKSQWVCSARLMLPRHMGDTSSITWASMCASPPLLAWAEMMDFSEVLRSSGEVLPLRHVRVARWSLDKDALTVKTVAREPQAVFDKHFGGEAASQQPASLFDVRQNASIMWHASAVILRTEGGRISACWRQAPHTLIAVRAWPPAVIWTQKSAASVVAVQEQVACIDAVPLLKTS